MDKHIIREKFRKVLDDLDPQVVFDEAPAKEVCSPFYPNITPDVEKIPSLSRSYPQEG